MQGFIQKIVQRGATGGIGILREKEGGMMVKDLTKFHKCHLGGGGRGILECVCVCLCRVSYRILSFGRGGTPTFGVDVEGVYST